MKRAILLTSGFVAFASIAACGGSGSSEGPSSDSLSNAGKSGGASGKGGASGGTAGTATAGKGGSATAGAAGTSAGAAGTASAGKAGSSAAGAAGTSAAGAAGKAGGSTAGAAGKAGGAGSAGGATNVQFCSATADCANNAVDKLCDTSTGKCVGCLASNDQCPKGQFCSTQSDQCSAGCKADGDCGAPTAKCDTGKHTCVACLGSGDCPNGNICSNGSCVAGCDPVNKPCTGGLTCCGAGCHDTKTDLANCGACDNACPKPANAAATCSNGACGMGACAMGFADCNGDPSDGCEVNTALQGACVCQPGATQPCYNGPAGTQNVGVCKGGVQVCAPTGLGYLPGCVGQVLPGPEVCGDGMDHDCNGTPNDVPDVDGDGWTACNGDCCEDTTQCSTPKDVNPGAFDTGGDGVDNDCNGVKDDVPPCTTGVKFAGVTPTDVANAIELCKFTTANPPPAQKTWGVLSSQFLLANGADPGGQLANIQNWQVAILSDYGTGGVTPRQGPTMVGMSSGKMRDQNDSGYVNPNGGTGFGSSVSPPAVYLAAHGGNLVASAGCSGNCPAGSGANDSVLARLQVRTPTNAQSFSYDLRFFSSEYWTYQCTAFNDFFLALLTQGGTQIPADKNISFDSKNNPISVNNGFFESCVTKGCNTCPDGTGALQGTGMQIGNTGGGTKWLTTQVGITSGETITLDLTIFDVSDGILDSLVLVDNFKFLTTPSGPPTTKPAQ